MAQEGEEDRARKEFAKRMREQQLEQQKREILRRFLTPEAFERISNVRLANPELYNKFVDLVIAMAQSNRLSAKITEAQLTELLSKLTEKTQPNIEFRHK